MSMTDDLKQLCMPLPWEAKEVEFSEHYAKQECGTQQLSWAVDAYWGLITQRNIIPNAIAMHAFLVEKNHTVDNKWESCGADVYYYYIECKNAKVIVLLTQGIDYLMMLSDNGKSFHVRRIYRQLKKDGMYPSAKEICKNIQSAIANVPTLEEYNDDHHRFSRRPSLEAYRNINFNMERYTGQLTYCDFRDPGYVLSYFAPPTSRHSRIEGSTYSFHDLCNVYDRLTWAMETIEEENSNAVDEEA